MTQSFHPDIYWMRRALLMGILTHPFVTKAQVRYPPLEGVEPEIVTIQRGRLFGGPELVEPGLTLAVYPYHSGYDPLQGAPPDTLSSEKSMIYPLANEAKAKFSTLGGARGNREHGQHAVIKFMVQLYYRDTVYDTPLAISADYIDQDDVVAEDFYGYRFQYKDDSLTELPTLQDKTKKFVKTKTINVQVLPGEEVLTQWLDIIKFAVRELKVLQPFNSVRNPSVLCADFPTSTWTAKSSNLIFHTAYLVVQYDVVEPPIPPFLTLPLVQQLDIKTES